MAKTPKPVNRQRLAQAIESAEAEGPLANRQTLYASAAERYLDDMAQADLAEFTLFGEGDRMAIAEVCFPTAPFGLAMLTVDRLMAYAEAKLWAISNRLDGNMRLAIRLERRCDAIYEGLPEFARL